MLLLQQQLLVLVLVLALKWRGWMDALEDSTSTRSLIRVKVFVEHWHLSAQESVWP